MSYLSVSQLSQLLNVKPSLIYSLVESHKISYYRMGDRLIRFTETDVERFIEGCRHEAKNPGTTTKGIRNLDVDSLVKKTIDNAKSMVYIRHHGKPNRNKGLRKESDRDGAL